MNALDTEIKEIETKLEDRNSFGSECEVYSRISGYYRSTKNWNAGKAAELKERLNYIISR